EPERLRGNIGLVVPDLIALQRRLANVASLLSHTEFGFTARENFVEVTCPWGNRFRCHAPADEFGAIELGLVYVEFTVPMGTAAGIADFYREIIGARAAMLVNDGSITSKVRAGRDQHLLFRETEEPLPLYDGHHIQIYIADFS